MKNTEKGYGFVSITLHWFMASSIFFMFGLGLYMVKLTYYDAWYKGSLNLHKSLGLLLFFVLLIRITWRFIYISPKALSDKHWEVVAGHAVHFLLYVLIMILMFSGYLISTADGRAIHVFEFFSVPALPFSLENQEDIAGNIHEILAWSLILLVALHILAALKHHFLDRDKTLIRMLKP